MISLEHLDHVITLSLNSLHFRWGDQLWLAFSDKEFWFPAYAIIAFMLFKRLGWKRALVVVASIILSIVLADQISNGIKHGVERLRPCFNTWVLQHGLHWQDTRGWNFFGFFSGHASNTFAFIACTVMGFRNDKSHTYNAFARWGYLWAVLVSVSRVMMGKHFFGDIFVGTFFGLLTGWLCGYLARWIIGKYIDRKPVYVRA